MLPHPSPSPAAVNLDNRNLPADRRFAIVVCRPDEPGECAATDLSERLADLLVGTFNRASCRHNATTRAFVVKIGPAGGAGFRRIKYKREFAVYTVLTPPDFRPQRPWSWPAAFSEGRLLYKRLSRRQAQGYAEVFNKLQLRRCTQGEWDHVWALVCPHLSYTPAGEK